MLKKQQEGLHFVISLACPVAVAAALLESFADKFLRPLAFASPNSMQMLLMKNCDDAINWAPRTDGDPPSNLILPAKRR